MANKKTWLFNLTIDTCGEACSLYEPRFAAYGTIETYGDNLDQCLENAMVNIEDQDGGEIAVVPASGGPLGWMIERAVMHKANEGREAAHDNWVNQKIDERKGS